MRRILLALCLSLVALACSAPSRANLATTPTAALAAEQQRKEVTVYVTRTSERYHREGCRHLRRSKIPLSISEAVTKGYTPCKVCRPKQ